ncbi:gliding motility-associated ABC transporter substrate-binding protein GldG [Kaistella antarctica]|uniref:Gliding motility protein GldG n=1 Tax=Kaistella antarctica TaxID=266748 RepID=A0A3S4VBL8_9FLAO|nr:gliding motility-associated ABC transporter substrate-binding protein GldG [Kaistella antarctica]KEY19976.1 gliding motility protein GldG [Kaistella antarctica]SEV95199.1 gliding-associated putative ABC transporter substrate-binding component GldG [Kaistella antarctica]VEH95885.1 gliding-associated putative ABC transporter substrate-binding component GldG [Kaistella antarctica]
MNKKIIIQIIFAFLLLMGIFAKRFDLTQEKRYTLSEATLKVLKSVEKPMTFDVYLDGDFPATFRQLQNETKFMLEEFRKVNPNIDYKFIDPIKTKMSKDTLAAMGIQPSILPDMKEGKISEIVMFPYAAIKYNSQGTSIPLIVNLSGIDASEQLRKSIENLEYNFVSNIKRITADRKKTIGILINQDELRPDEFQGFMEMALENYNAGPIIPKNQTELTYEDVPQLQHMDALVIAKPRKAFSESEKVILDQYIMNGGKTLWMIDAVNAEMDTLFQAKKIMAFPMETNLTDFFFNYGIRLNAGLVKDFKKSALIRIVSGEVAGNPQYSSFLWPYFPLGIAENKNPITKNINPVKFEFPTSIDTLGRKDIKTKVLFESSDRTTTKQVPDYVALSEIVQADSINSSNKPTEPKIFAVSLEGKFTSAYSTRSEKNIYPNFKAESPENKMIIIADGDIGRNQIYKGNALPLGEDLLTKQAYGNEQFLRNALDFLLDDSNLMELRNRNIEARLLDRQRIDEEQSYWQWLNLLLPLAIIGLLGGFFYWWRKRKFG